MDNLAIKGLHKAHENFPEGGLCLEFGVFIGNSYINTAELLQTLYTNSSIIGFDSWQGLPPETEGIWFPERHRAGEFRTSKNVVQERLRLLGLRHDPRFKLIDGFFCDSLTAELQSSLENLIYVNIDVDIHSSTVEALNFIKPMLRKGVILYFDDWKDPQDKFEGKWGEHLAWEEFTSINPEIKWNTLEVNKYNQRCIEIE